MCICGIYAYVYIHIYVCIYVCVCVCIYIYIYIYICAVIPHTALLSHSELPQGKFLNRDSPTYSVRNLIMGHVWIFQPYNNPNTNLKNKTKLLLWPFQSSDLNPVENEWGELKRRSTNMELWIWRIWRDSGWRNGLWSLVRCSLTSSGIIGENLELLNWQMEVSKSIE